MKPEYCLLKVLKKCKNLSSEVMSNFFRIKTYICQSIKEVNIILV